MENSQKILEKHASSTPSRWREKGEWRRINRKWLKKSQQIAMAVMDYMEDAKMSQKDLAEKMMASPQYICKLLKGDQNLSLETISKLEEILGIDILVVRNFKMIQQITPVIDWSRPTFKIVKPAVECNQEYDAITTSTMSDDGGCIAA